MSNKSYLNKKRIDFSELDDHFDDDQHNYRSDIDSAVQIKRKTEPDRLNEVKNLLEYSPNCESDKKKQTSVRCSFGLNNTNNHFNQLKLQSAQGSVNNSLQISSPDTASFPLQKKFLKIQHLRTSIEEDSAEYEQSCKEPTSHKKQRQTENTHNSQQQQLDEIILEEDDYQDEEQLLDEFLDKKQEAKQWIKQILQALTETKEYCDELSSKNQQQQSAIRQLELLNQELAETLDETQRQMKLLSDTNIKLKKKLQQNKTYNTEQSMNQGNTQTTSRNKENSNYYNQNSDIVTQLSKSSESLEQKKQLKIISTFQNILNMDLLMIQKCFYLDEQIDKDGRETINKLLSQINNKQLESFQDNLVAYTEQLIKYFEQRYCNLVDRAQEYRSLNSMLDQIQILLNDRHK